MESTEQKTTDAPTVTDQTITENSTSETTEQAAAAGQTESPEDPTENPSAADPSESQGSGESEGQETLSLADLNVSQIKEFLKDDLIALCEVEKLPVGGTKKELIDRLITKKMGRSDRYVGRLTKCKVCGKSVVVKGTARTPFGDGETLVTRNIRCTGKNAHSYPLKEVVPAQKKRLAHFANRISTFVG